MVGVDVDTLTMEQYLALSRENQAPSMVKPEIRDNVNFEIKSQFMRELTEDTFLGNKDEDTHDHIDRRWVDIIAPRTINTWDLLKKAFIQRYCPPSMTAKQLEDIHNFKQEGDESLYQAWER
ncbi:putative reverse transcriptase domain-containing protein, partial [Tanacetum coccineum]